MTDIEKAARQMARICGPQSFAALAIADLDQARRNGYFSCIFLENDLWMVYVSKITDLN